MSEHGAARIGPGQVSVIICAYTEDRLEQTLRAVASVRRQEGGSPECLVVVDHNPRLAALLAERASGGRVLENEERRGLSGGRNTGIRHARGGALAFLDDDAEAAPDWLARMCRHLDDPAVKVVGGFTEPEWEAHEPGWFPSELLWTVGCTYTGAPTVSGDVRNVFGGNMLVRREVFETVGPFTNGIGRAGGRPVGCEETELCIRIRQRMPGARVVWEPAARIGHFVPAARVTWRYLRSRCYAEGLSKAAVSRLLGAQDGLETERGYVLKVLPRGVARGMGLALRGRVAGAASAAAIVVGLAATVAGYGVGLVTTRAADS